MRERNARLAFVMNAMTGSGLKGGAYDVTQVYAFLTNEEFGRCDPTLSSKPLYDCPNKSTFMQNWQSCLANYQPGDQLVFYFSGHGVKRGGIYCLKVGNDATDVYPFQNIMMDLTTCDVDRAIFILDACYSGAATKGGPPSPGYADPNGMLEWLGSPRGIAILASSTEHQLSEETADQEQRPGSVFTRLLCQAVQTGLGGRATRDGLICLDDIVIYLTEQLEHSESLRRYRQRPQLKATQTEGRIWLALNQTKAEPHRIQSPPPGRAPRTQAASMYLQRLAEEASRIRILGLNSDSEIKLSVEHAYIPISFTILRSLVEREHPDAADIIRDRDSLDCSIGLEEIFSRVCGLGLRGAILRGEPGSGKSTAARYLCWQLASGRSSPQHFGLPAQIFPVLLRLHNFQRNGHGFGLRALLHRETRSALAVSDLAEPAEDILKEPCLLWVLDGLDEVAEDEVRSLVSEEIRAALQYRPDDFFLVTCRSVGYRGRVVLGDDFLSVIANPLGEQQVSDYVAHWHQAVLRRMKGGSPQTDADARELARSLIELLGYDEFRIGRIRELRSNPLLLSILCMVHLREGSNLPRRRADLYSSCLATLLQYWRQNLRRNQGLPPHNAAAAMSVLAAIAWRFHEEEDRTAMNDAQLVALAEEKLATIANDTGLGRSGAGFIKRVQEDCKILVTSNPGRSGFLHLIFQEYLAALYATQESMIDVLVHCFGRSWWREVTLLSLAIGSRSFIAQFFGKMLEIPSLEKHGDFIEQCISHAQFVVLEPLLDHLKSPSISRARKLQLLQLLRGYTDQALLEIALEIVWEDDVELSAFAQEILQRHLSRLDADGDRTAVRHPDPKARTLAAWRVVFTTTPASVPRLQELLACPDPRIRAAAARTLGTLGDAALEATAALGARLQVDESAAVRDAAYAALWSLGADKLPAEQRSLLDAARPQREPSDPCLNVEILHSVQVDSRTGVAFLHLPEGFFEMGSDEGPDEAPRHRIFLHSFLISKYPITNEEYQIFLQACPGRKTPFYWDDPRFNDPKQPVVGVTWFDALAYCEWAGYRLPTEAEWEYACRAGTSTRFSFGDRDTNICDYAWSSKNAEDRTHRVGAKKPNQWGLHDMCGNVWEWCADWYGEDYYTHCEPDNPQGPSHGRKRVLRGGTFYYGSEQCRSAKRDGNLPERRSYDFGFRVVNALVRQSSRQAAAGK